MSLDIDIGASQAGFTPKIPTEDIGRTPLPLAQDVALAFEEKVREHISTNSSGVDHPIYHDTPLQTLALENLEQGEKHPELKPLLETSAEAAINLSHSRVNEQELALDAIGADLGVINKIAFRRKMERLLFSIAREDVYNESSRSISQGWAVLVIDSNGMKEVNDGCGHAVGDELIYAQLKVIVDEFRDDVVVARVGGDEYVVMAPFDTPATAQYVMDGYVKNKEESPSPMDVGTQIRVGRAELIKAKIDIERELLRQQNSATWPADTPDKKMGQVAIGWSYVNRDQLSRWQQEPEATVDSVMKHMLEVADQKMYVDKGAASRA